MSHAFASDILEIGPDMQWHHRLGLLYTVLVILILAMGAWWMYYINREGQNYERYQFQRLATDRLHAVFLLQLDPIVADNPHAALGDTYPHLRFERNGAEWNVSIDPVVHQAVHDEAERRNRMFLGEGLFFLALLIAGTTILTLAFRREREFKRARELFLAGATHELKTPLACIRLYTETLERTDLDDEARRRIHHSLVKDIERLEEMMEQILSVSRDEDGPSRRPETLDLADEANELLDAMRAFLDGNDATVTSELPAGRLIRGDRQDLRVAVRNLLQNAVHHGASPATIHIALTTGDNHHRLSVSDDGPGVPRRDQEKIFDSFYRANTGGDRPPGAGLGLYLVRRTAEALGGLVSLDSEEGRGATFTLTLPVHREERS